MASAAEAEAETEADAGRFVCASSRLDDSNVTESRR